MIGRDFAFYTADPASGLVDHKYGFTNNEFFAFIADLDPVDYIITLTVIAILINVNLNIFEQYVLSGFLLDLAITSQNMVQQEGFRLTLEGQEIGRQRAEARQENFDQLYQDMDRLQNELNQLRAQTTPSE